jgi:hypothetical protein
MDFPACPSAQRTQFVGAIIGRGAGCVALDVHRDGGPPVGIRLLLGSGCR